MPSFQSVDAQINIKPLASHLPRSGVFQFLGTNYGMWQNSLMS